MSDLKREILYRGKQKGSGDWVEGVPVQHSDGDWQIQGGYSDAGWRVTVMPETICEYTGLTDKNGRKIFEGDVIQYTDEVIGKEKVDEVEYNETHAAFCRLHKSEMGLQYLWLDEAIANKCEVIGNIFDDPELLEGPI